MCNDLNLSELFDQYLENDLNINARKAFELRIKEDPSFAERFRLHQEVDHALIEDDILNFRLKLQKVEARNLELAQSAPMIVSEELPLEMDQAIVEQDIITLLDQLNRIHTAVIEEVDPLEIPAYSNVERAILDQDSVNLNHELGLLDPFAFSTEDHLDQLSRDVDKAIMQEDIISLRCSLEEIGENMASSRKTMPLRKKVVNLAYTAVAAVFVLLIAGSFFLNQNSGSHNPDRVFAKYFQVYDGLGNKRGPSEDGSKIIELGIQKYNKGDFANALELFEACMTDESRTETILLYAGSSALMTGDPDKALKYFANWDENSPVYDQVEWYSAGCYLKKGDIDKTKAIIKKISADPENSYYNEAIALLKNIGKED